MPSAAWPAHAFVPVPNACGMPAQQFTRCPACNTVFRVTPEQLGVRAGQVRCGHCKNVFDGIAQLVPARSLAAPEEPSPHVDEPAATPAAAVAEAASEPAPQPASEAPGALGALRPVDYEERFSWPRQERRRRAATLVYGLGAPLLVLLLAGQAVYHFRDDVVARWPGTRPAMSYFCGLLGCQIRPVREIAAVSIDASDLQADEAHRGLLVLTATLRNRAPWPVSYPYLELTLMDTRDQPVARRALLPREYAGAADLGVGIPANAEIPVRLYLDASATEQAGYRLYLFYP